VATTGGALGVALCGVVTGGEVTTGALAVVLGGAATGEGLGVAGGGVTFDGGVGVALGDDDETWEFGGTLDVLDEGVLTFADVLTAGVTYGVV
jgi:hypothetical protein